jgi:hypothetical protein
LFSSFYLYCAAVQADIALLPALQQYFSVACNPILTLHKNSSFQKISPRFDKTKEVHELIILVFVCTTFVLRQRTT